MIILVDSGGSSEICQKNVRMTTIDRFGGHSETCQQIVLGKLIVVKQNTKDCPRIIVLHFISKYGPKKMRRPKAAAPLLGAVEGRGHTLVKKM